MYFFKKLYLFKVTYTKYDVFNYYLSIIEYNGLIKIDKDATNKKIDPIDAILGGFKLAMYHEFEVDLGKYLTEDTFKKLWG